MNLQNRLSKRNFLRSGLAAIVALSVCPVLFAAGQRMIPSLPVFSWLVLGESTPQSIAAKLPSIKATVHEGVFSATGGPLINLANPLGDIEGEAGLRIVSMGFGAGRKLEMVTWTLDRGVRDANVQPLVNRMTERYGAYVTPYLIEDTRSSGYVDLDQYVLFDFGNYVVLVSIPKMGTFIKTIFATRPLFDQLTRINGTESLFQPYL